MRLQASMWVQAGATAAGALAAAAMASRGAAGPAAWPLEPDAAMVRLYARQGQAAAARSAAQALVERSGAAGYARLAQAAAAYHTGDAAGAAAVYRDLLAADPEAPVLLFNLGMALRRAGHGDEAADVLRRAGSASRGTLPGLAEILSSADGKGDR